MKKKILGGIAVLAIVAIAVFNVNFAPKNSKLSYVSLANVEALALDEVNNSYTAGIKTVTSYTTTRQQNGKTLTCYVTATSCNGSGSVQCSESYYESCN